MCEEDGKCVKKFIRHLRKTEDFKIQYQKMDESTPTISSYAEACFAGNTDFMSQLRMVIFLSDESVSCRLLHYGLYKDTRVTKAVLAGGIHAFGTAFDVSHLRKHDLRLILGRKIPVWMFTESRSLFDLVTNTSYTAEKRLTIDITYICNVFKLGDIHDVGSYTIGANPC